MKYLRQTIQYLPKEILEINDLLGDHRHAVIAGGAARSLLTQEPINDLDLFLVNCFEYQLEKEKLIDDLKDNHELIFQCPQGLLYSFKTSTGLKIQVICKENYTSSEALLNSFDFTLCQFAYTPKYKALVWPQKAGEDVRQKTLRVHKLTYPVASLKRMTKYISYGYKPVDHFYLNLFNEINNFDIENEDDLALYID